MRRRKYSEWAIFTATVAVKIASQLFLRLAVNIASAFFPHEENQIFLAIAPDDGDEQDHP